MELFAIICLALIIVAVVIFVTWLWIKTDKYDGAMVIWSIVLTVVCAVIVTWLGYWLIIWGGQYFVNMGWWYFDQQ